MEPGSGVVSKARLQRDAFALVLPEASTVAMRIFLDEFAKTTAPDEHVLTGLDQAGWHIANALEVPSAITLVTLSTGSQEPNPVERARLSFKER